MKAIEHIKEIADEIERFSSSAPNETVAVIKTSDGNPFQSPIMYVTLEYHYKFLLRAFRVMREIAKEGKNQYATIEEIEKLNDEEFEERMSATK